MRYTRSATWHAITSQNTPVRTMTTVYPQPSAKSVFQNPSDPPDDKEVMTPKKPLKLRVLNDNK